MRNLVWIILVLFTPAITLCQDYNYSRYDIKEGLAGSTVYCVTQDKEGFLWFGTETGLSRFDGTHFKNFTRKDGLPDNEIIQLYSDSKGRIWISPFRKTVCYYYQGKFYTRDNDPVLRKLTIAEAAVRFAEDYQGNILIQEPGRLHLVETNGNAITIDRVLGGKADTIISVAARKAGGFFVAQNDRMLVYEKHQFTEKSKLDVGTNHFNYVTFAGETFICRNKALFLALEDANTNKVVAYPQFTVLSGFQRFCTVNDSLVAVCTARAAYLFNIAHPEKVDTVVTESPITGVFKDREGNMWMTTNGEGVYRFASPHVKTLKTGIEHLTRQVLCLSRYFNRVLAGTDINVLYKFDQLTGKPAPPHITLKDFGVEPIVNILPFKDSSIVYASKQMLFRLSPTLKLQHLVFFTYNKGLQSYSNNQILVASSSNVVLRDRHTLKILDTVWNERSTAVFASHDTIYVGTVNGLYCRLPSKKMIFLAEKHPQFANRITAVTKDSANMLWVATSGEGVFGFRNGMIQVHLSEENGLTSNISRTLFVDDKLLWIGTDKGLNRVSLVNPRLPVQKYTTADGLASDIINAILVTNNKVFVATPAGITFFDEQKIRSDSRCDLVFSDIAINGKHNQQWKRQPIIIPHEENNVRFDYVGISYRSAGDIRYKYRMLGLDTVWKTTRETNVSYPTMPSGDYELQVQAVNKFDVASKMLIAKFTIEPLFYERNWFRIVAAIILLTLIGLLIFTITHRIRKREEEKTAINKRIGDLEQLSLKAQMNPHFIFNSLNSIQQYVIDSDITGANKFISGFSRLIRQTLDFSSRKDISLEEELDYLSNYLELEKTRLENAFTWEMIVESGIHPADYYIPPMLMQPFVENSVRHGLRFRKDNKGKVSILIKKLDNALVCVIEDNGIGRKAAIQLKSNSHIEYQSRGMSLTADRITMWNKDHITKIVMRIDDLVDDGDNALGTRVTLTFPIY